MWSLLQCALAIEVHPAVPECRQGERQAEPQKHLAHTPARAALHAERPQNLDVSAALVTCH
jgi:hypothetical protein